MAEFEAEKKSMKEDILNLEQDDIIEKGIRER